MVTSVGIAYYSCSDCLLIVTEKNYRKPDRLEDISSRLQVETDNSPRPQNVLEALIRDGYNPILLSTIICSRSIDARIKQVNRAVHLKTGLLCNDTTNVLPAADLIVPNVVHYVLTGPNKTFHFMSYLSFLSVDRFITPEQIFVHGDQAPSGHWWNVTVHHVRNIYFVQRPYVDTAPNGLRFNYPAHSSDYLRAEILVRYGGIYLDPDVIVLKSFDPLRNYSLVLGRETSIGVCNGIMIAKKDSVFIRLMLELYRSYRGPKEEWEEKSVLNVHTLAQLYPHLVHVEETSLHRPNWMEMDMIHSGLYNWTDNYAMHMWIRMWPPEKRPSGPDDVRNRSTTLGQISHLVLYGETPDEYI